MGKQEGLCVHLQLSTKRAHNIRMEHGTVHFLREEMDVMMSKSNTLVSHLHLIFAIITPINSPPTTIICLSSSTDQLISHLIKLRSTPISPISPIHHPSFYLIRSCPSPHWRNTWPLDHLYILAIISTSHRLFLIPISPFTHDQPPSTYHTKLFIMSLNCIMSCTVVSQRYYC